MPGEARQQPADPLALGVHLVGEHRAERAEHHHHHGAVAAFLTRHGLGDQGDARAQFSGQPHPGDEPHDAVGDHIEGEGVDDVGRAVEQDAAEQHGDAALLVAPHPPEDPTHQHAQHLHVEQVDPDLREPRVVRTQDGEQALPLHHVEEHQVVDVHEVAQGRHHDQQQAPTVRRGVRHAERVSPRGGPAVRPRISGRSANRANGRWRGTPGIPRRGPRPAPSPRKRCPWARR